MYDERLECLALNSPNSVGDQLDLFIDKHVSGYRHDIYIEIVTGSASFNEKTNQDFGAWVPAKKGIHENENGFSMSYEDCFYRGRKWELNFDKNLGKVTVVRYPQTGIEETISFKCIR